MPSAPQSIYWDSDCFLSYVNGEEPRISVLDALFESSRMNEIRLYTSEISQVEVAFGASEQRRRELDADIERRLDSLWEDAEVVAVVGYHDRVGLSARGMIRNAIRRGWSLKPMDAIHLATARWLIGANVGVSEFHTYDQRLFKYADIAGFPISEPRILQPNLL